MPQGDQGQQGPIPIPGTPGAATPLTSVQQQTEALKHGQLPSDSGQAPPEHPGSWEDQINRAAYLFQSGQQPDPAPDHGGKSYEIDPEAMQGMINRYNALADESEDFARQLGDARDKAHPPAGDLKSGQHVKAYYESMNKAIADAKGATKYLRDMVNDLKKAQSGYRQVDDQAAQNVRRSQA